MASSMNSQVQFALLSLILEFLLIEPQRVQIFEPIFQENDIQLIQEVGFNLITNNIGRHKAESPTLFYMPHCPEGLYNNLLLENWTMEHLPNVLVFGNSFNYYHHKRDLTTGMMIIKAARYYQEFSLGDYLNDQYLELAFSNTSLHIPSAKTLRDNTNSNFWSQKGNLVTGSEVIC
eukprot:TRINITY_DN9296_c0_g1_i1.p1 TRINITY_DN9296_c0_g1~~TRINITY_DN9296_c0_g1_i1.p1  ORF type:complete len:176 (-),score=29.71 TRINITY_DN9296_c0_g1_i1:12-539(-)